jgi:hypothetical protein
MENQKNISNVEWGMVIGALIFIDIIQLILDLFGIGLGVNTVIDIGVGMALGFYLQLRGQKPFSKKRIKGFLGAFIGELIPGLNALPLWTLDGFYLFAVYKKEKLLAYMPGGQSISKVIG